MANVQKVERKGLLCYNVAVVSDPFAYATRAIESGMQPKVLQELLGHASIKTTMDRYVHVTDDSKLKAIELFEQNNPMDDSA